MTKIGDKLLTLSDCLVDRAAQSPDTNLAIFPDAEITYAQVLAQSRRLAKGLIALGLKPGEHAGILMPSCLHFVLAHFAVQLAGGVGVLLNARFKQHELSHAVGHSDVRILLTTAAVDQYVDFANILTTTFPELLRASAEETFSNAAAPLLKHVVMFGNNGWKAALSDGDLVSLGKDVPDTVLDANGADRDSESTAIIIYTSGTTANPKACELSHAGLQRSWGIFTQAVGVAEGEKIWDPMPVFHAGGVGIMTSLVVRGATILMTPNYDADLIAGLIEKYRVEHLYPGFHTLAVPLFQSRHYDRDRWGAFVKTVANCGPIGTQYALRNALPAHVPIMNLYGLSESSGVLTFMSPHAPETLRLTSSGRGAGGAQLRIINPETLEDYPPGVVGEIVFRGAGAFRGYYKDAAATRATILPGGWVRTGDLGEMDPDGWLFFRGRLKDMLKVGGENVSAAELESFLSGHSAVKFVQVVGQPDEVLGEFPVAFIELNPGMASTQEEIVSFCKGKIANYKIPRGVKFVTEWPMSATKIQKFKLKEFLRVDVE